MDSIIKEKIPFHARMLAYTILGFLSGAGITAYLLISKIVYYSMFHVLSLSCVCSIIMIFLISCYGEYRYKKTRGSTK